MAIERKDCIKWVVGRHFTIEFISGADCVNFLANENMGREVVIQLQTEGLINLRDALNLAIEHQQALGGEAD